VYAGGASIEVGEGLGCYSVDWLLALFISRSREDVELSAYGLCSIWWPRNDFVFSHIGLDPSFVEIT